VLQLLAHVVRLQDVDDRAVCSPPVRDVDAQRQSGAEEGRTSSRWRGELRVGRWTTISRRLRRGARPR
jgi:hypothetical protein